MEKRWWCASCFTQMNLDIHGRCSTCGSDAVDRIVRDASRMNAQEQTPRPSKSLWGLSLQYWKTKLKGKWMGGNAQQCSVTAELVRRF